MQRQRYVSLGGPNAGIYDAPPPLDCDRILPIAIKAMPDIVSLLEKLIELFPERMLPDQMSSIIERSPRVAEVSNEIKSKIYCVLDGKTVLGRVRMMFITDNFQEVASFLHNGNRWKRQPDLRQGLLYMLKDPQGGEPYAPITPPKPSASSSSVYRREHSAPSPCSPHQSAPGPTPSSWSTPSRLPISQNTNFSISSASRNTTTTNSGRKIPHCRTCGERMKGHDDNVCMCKWCGRPKLAHNGKACQPRAPFPTASASSASSRETFQLSEGQSTATSSKAGRARSVISDKLPYNCQPRAPLPAARASSASTSQKPESQSTPSSSKGKGRATSETSDSDSEVGLGLEERVTRLEIFFRFLGIDERSMA